MVRYGVGKVKHEEKTETGTATSNIMALVRSQAATACCLSLSSLQQKYTIWKYKEITNVLAVKPLCQKYTTKLYMKYENMNIEIEVN